MSLLIRCCNRIVGLHNINRLLLSLLLLLQLLSRGTATAAESMKDNDAATTITTPTRTLSCSFVMAESTIPNSGYGVYSLQPHIPPNHVVLPGGDPVIQVTNLTPEQAAEGIAFMLHHYAWLPHHTGGQVESTVSVESIVPGLAMLANSHPIRFNIVPGHPEQDHAGLVRGQAGAGAVTHYQEFKWYARDSIAAGDELFVHHGGVVWNHEAYRTDFDTFEQRRSLEWLSEHGMCLDLIRPGLSDGRGRGAFATRQLRMGSVISPIPVIALNRTSLDIYDAAILGINSKQLLLNYCYGHVNSTVLLFPYSPVVNLLNHEHAMPNAFVRWSTRMQDKDSWLLSSDVLERQASGLLLELVALRTIEPGEEVVINYGDAFEQAWQWHKQSYQDIMEKWGDYAYSSQVNRVVRTVKTVAEQIKEPYPSNVVTSCLHVYGHAIKTAERELAEDGTTVVTRAIWDSNLTHVYQPLYLRPCLILERQQVTVDDHGPPGNKQAVMDLYTVQFQSGPGSSPLFPEETIPAGETHIVSELPRQAIYFSDKPYTTDQHLKYAFRHEIGLPPGTFPSAWKDLS